MVTFTVCLLTIVSVYLFTLLEKKANSSCLISNEQSCEDLKNKNLIFSVLYAFYRIGTRVNGTNRLQGLYLF